MDTLDERAKTMANLELVGGALCLDFVNTVGDRRRDQHTEWLTNYGDLLVWGRQAGILTDAAADRLWAEAQARPEAAAAVHEAATSTREALFRLFDALAVGLAPDPADTAMLNTALAGALAHSQLVPVGTGFAWSWQAAPEALDQVLWPVLRSAADLLTSESVIRVHACADQTCGWLFVDTSRNGSRRWCTMEGCGNRAKARRHYQRRARTAPAHV